MRVKKGLALAGILYSLSVSAQLTLSPKEIDVRDITRSEKVFITHDGQPVMAGEIKKIVSGVYKTGDAVPERVAGSTHFSDYSFMFEFVPGDDGSITLIPNKDLLEVGAYELFVHTVYGTVSGVINANLEDSNPARPHHPVKTSRLSNYGKQGGYLYGQVVSIDLSPDNKNTYTWSIDGETHSTGPGMTSFRAWPEAGLHEVTAVARNAGGVIVSTWSDTVKVVKEEVIKTSVRLGSNVSFRAPGGYLQATWAFDGKLVSDHHLKRSLNDTQLISFEDRGTHILTCKVQGLENGNFRLITWAVDVK